MDVTAKLRVPDYIYKFYQNAARNIANQTTEQTMADALSAYAAMLSKDVRQGRQSDIENAFPDICSDSV